MTDPLRILLVEDHEPSATALCKLLVAKFEGCCCEVACTLEEGLAKSIDFQAHITLLDLGLPDRTVDEAIRAIPFFPPPVIVVTDQEDPDNHLMLKCFEYEAENFYSKAFLRAIIDGIDATTEIDKIISSITSAVFRNTLPRNREEREGKGRAGSHHGGE